MEPKVQLCTIKQFIHIYIHVYTLPVPLSDGCDLLEDTEEGEEGSQVTRDIVDNEGDKVAVTLTEERGELEEGPLLTRLVQDRLPEMEKRREEEDREERVEARGR